VTANVGKAATLHASEMRCCWPCW